MRSTQLKIKLAGLLIVAILAALSLPAFAAAQQSSPSQHQYSNSLSQVSTGGNEGAGGGGGVVSSGGGGATSPSAGSGGLGGNVGPLPFTGFDVIAMAAVALAVTGLGLALQRAVSRDPRDQLS